MNNFLKRFSLLGIIVIVGILYGCGSGEETKADGENQSDGIDSMTMELVTTLPYAEHKVLLDSLEENLKNNSDDKFSIDMFTDGTLGGEAQGLEQVSTGEINMGLGVLHSSIYYPEYDAPGVPYLFSDYESIFKYMEGPMGQKIDKILLEEANLIQIGYYKSGPRWTTANRPVENADDFKDLKIRLSENPLHLGVFSVLDAVITPMPSTDVFTALQTGVIDSQENWITNIVGRHIYEVQDYLIKTDHILSFGTFLVNADWWNGLSDKERDLIQSAVDDSLEKGNSILEEEQQRSIDYLTGEGNMELVEPDIDSIREAVQGGIQNVIEENLDPEVQEELSSMGILK
jgi:TRAP-type C4-dicarboxylate transport system substrate-binding protein